MLKLVALFLCHISLFSHPLSMQERREMIVSGVYHDGCPVPLDALRHVEILYHDTAHTRQKGVLIVHKDVESEVKEIFKSLFEAGFTIAQMRPIRDFNASDEASMSANNTSAFNCRHIKGTSKFSNHSYGKAIDINPLWNPCIVKGEVSPIEGKAFVDREAYHDGMIHKEDFIVKIFKKHGWKWGGEWKSLKDYQHFEKER